MHKLAKTLLGGVAFSALAIAPSIAQHEHPAFTFTALHAGRVVHKTRFHNRHHRHHCLHIHSSCTFSLYTYLPASNLHTTVPLAATFYKFNNSSTICSAPKTKINAPRKTPYARIGTATETYSLGCPSGPTKFYGDTYKLTDPNAKIDQFVSVLNGRLTNKGVQYKARLILYVDVLIETE